MDLKSYAKEELNKCSYKWLQQLAKSLKLPCNMKKADIVKLINAKKYCTEEVVNDLVKQVKLKRLQIALKKEGKQTKRRKFVQIKKIRSTSTSYITQTKTYNVKKTRTKQKSNRSTTSNVVSSKIQHCDEFSSDRVLRSCQMKPARALDEFHTHETIYRLYKRRTQTYDRSTMRVQDWKDNNNNYIVDRNITSSSPPIILGEQQLPSRRRQVPRCLNSTCSSTSIFGPGPSTNSTEMEEVQFNDGTSLNFLCDNEEYSKVKTHAKCIATQTDSQITNNSLLDTEKTLIQLDTSSNSNASQSSKQTEEDYYHSTRSEHDVHESTPSVSPKIIIKLPNINEAFTRFKNIVYNDSVPIYTQASQSRTVPSSHVPQYNTNGSPRPLGVLEDIFNINKKFLETNPYLYSVKPAATNYVNSNPKYITTSTLLQTGTQQNQGCMGFTQTSTTASEFFSTNSDLVEDALELISQDRTYIEGIDLKIEMQCLLCSWFGPKAILENHLREIHEADIMKKDGPLWIMTYSVGGLVSRDTWSCRVIEYDGLLYVLSVKLEHTQRFTHTVSLLSYTTNPINVSMTIYNKETCEPRTWRGEAKGTPETLPYENNSEGLSLKLSEVNLLMPGTILVRKSVLNDIHITVFINIM